MEKKDTNFQFKVSSVLNNDTKSYGRKHMFDDNEITCWSSDQGTPQWIQILFEVEEMITGFRIQFQGGFAGKDCQFELYSSKPSKGTEVNKIVEKFYPLDKNTLQEFKLTRTVKTKFLRVLFNNSSDPFGRIIVYQFRILTDVSPV